MRAAIAAIGPKFDENILLQTRALYAPLVPKPSGRVTVSNDVSYGADARQKLDVYQPASPNGNVLLFIPGGGFVGGDKNCRRRVLRQPRQLFRRTRHSRRWLRTIGWRLRTPGRRGRRTSARRWRGRAPTLKSTAARPIASSCSDSPPAPTHSAGYVFDPRFHPTDGVGIRACILMSGPYAVTRRRAARSGRISARMRDLCRAVADHPCRQRAKFRCCSVLPNTIPSFLAIPTYELAKIVTERDGKSPRVAYFAGHNHVSTVMSFGTAQDDVGATVRDFITASP